MKKMTAIMVMVCMFAFASTVSADYATRTKSMAGGGASDSNSMTTFGHKALYYIPNLLLDAFDIVDMTFGAGSQFSAEMHLTYGWQVGGWNGGSYFIGKGCNRQFGGGYLDGTNFGFFVGSYNNIIGDESFGTYKNFILTAEDFAPLSWNEDAFRDGDLDYFAIGGRFGWMLNISVDIHLIEVADLAAGVIMIDLKGDDL